MLSFTLDLGRLELSHDRFQGKSGNSLLDKFGFQPEGDSEDGDPQANVDWEYEVRRSCHLFLR